MVEEGIRGGICHAIHRYAKANNEYVENYNKHNESSYIQYWDKKNFYKWEMSRKLPVGRFKWKKNVANLLEVDTRYSKRFHNLHSDLPFFPEIMKTKKCSKLVYNPHDKKNYIVHIRALKQALNHELVFKKVHRVIQFNQKTWLKLYIDMNTKLRKKAKNDFEKDFLKLMNNAVFGKTMESLKKHRDIKIVTTDKRRNYLVSKPNYQTKKNGFQRVC